MNLQIKEKEILMKPLMQYQSYAITRKKEAFYKKFKNVYNFLKGSSLNSKMTLTPIISQ